MKCFLLAALVLSTASAAPLTSKAVPKSGRENGAKSEKKSGTKSSKKGSASSGYEVWASDQSNTVPGQTSLGVKGSLLWIWDSEAIEAQVNGQENALPLPCSPNDSVGPCDVFTIFPPTLQEFSAGDIPTGNTLNDLPGFGRLHGVLHDPQNKYVTASLFVPGGGYVGLIDTRTKEAIALFRVTKFNFGFTSNRSVHMSFWSADGSAVLIGNLDGKAIERINIIRNASGDIIEATLDTDATLGLGKDMSVAEPATYFLGENAFGNPLVGGVAGTYDHADLGDFTPNNVCKENGCNGPAASKGGRANNLPICPVPGQDNLLYITLAGGGMLVADSSTTPMSIIGEYGNQLIYGAGCGGVQVDTTMFINAGIAASPAGATQSMFALWAFENDKFLTGTANDENIPAPDVVFEDPGNTATGGNLAGPPSIDDGQIPGQTIRRDSHGIAATTNGKYIHTVDRIQNMVEVYNSKSFQRWTYDLTTLAKGDAAACLASSVADYPEEYKNDPSPDLMEMTPDGKYLMIALRGPAPVSVPHSTQGSCPGVAVVALQRSGKFGELVAVLRSTNKVPDLISVVSPPGGVDYEGNERSDVHGSIVVDKSFW